MKSPSRGREAVKSERWWRIEWLATKLLFGAAAVAAGATVLWLRQTTEALLQVSTFPAAIAQVAFWATPVLLMYLVLPRSRSLVVAQGVAIVVLQAVGWWSFAQDEHSTAGIGPGIAYWLLAPVGLGVWWVLVERSGRQHPPRL